MTRIAKHLAEAFQGGLLAVVLVRLSFLWGAAASPNLVTGQTEEAGILPLLLGRSFFVTPDQVALLALMSAGVLGAGLLWLMTTWLILVDRQANS